MKADMLLNKETKMEPNSFAQFYLNYPSYSIMSAFKFILNQFAAFAYNVFTTIIIIIIIIVINAINIIISISFILSL